MNLRFLGTGWSHGVPRIACTCPVCRAAHPRNLRKRTSILLEQDGFFLLVDAGPDLRSQVLEHHVTRVDAVLITHAHADHIMGLDDLRRFGWTQGQAIPVYADPGTLDHLRRIFPYVREDLDPELALPLIRFVPLGTTGTLGPFSVERLEVPHGPINASGFRIMAGGHSVGYVPDTHHLSEDHLDQLRGLDLMILNALRPEPHPAHLTLDAAVEHLRRIAAPRSFLTHMGCGLDYPRVNPTLPPGIEMAYDGLDLHL